jgi:outer membrane protein OmpA-like peptidoglycan-associated protein
MRLHYYIYTWLFLLCSSIFCHGQPAANKRYTEHFIPREIVVFSEDFSEDPAGSFPHNWDLVPCMSNQQTDDLHRKWVVKQVKHEKFVVDNTMQAHLVPRADLSKYLSDSFSMECDFFLDGTLSRLDVTIAPRLPDQRGKGLFACHRYSFYLWHWGEIGSCIGLGDNADTGNSRTHVHQAVFRLPSFDTTTWHHLGVSYKKNVLTIFVDSTKALLMPTIGYTPQNIMFCGWPSPRITNIRIATGPTAAPLRQLLKGKPVATHNILFDVGTAILKPASDKYLLELAQLLNENPTLKLKVCGHTDNTGTTAGNQVLSEQRASAVKEALVKRGITASRLDTKGFGSSQPLKTGNTEEAKAFNRRVEFVPF